jgi:hypothetical protein
MDRFCFLEVYNSWNCIVYLNYHFECNVGGSSFWEEEVWFCDLASYCKVYLFIKKPDLIHRSHY